MESEAKYALVGTMVLFLLAAVVAAVVWLRGSGQGDTVNYKIYFARQSLDGLQLRGDVKMKGIVVGAVTGFRISLWRPGSVEVLVRVGESTPVRQSTKAVVERQLLTGIASIRLVNANEDAPLLTQPADAEPYPVIAEGESELEQFSQSITQVAASADDTLRRISALLTEENRVALSATLGNLQRISANVDRGMSGLDQTLGGVNKTLASVGRAAEEVQGFRHELREGTATLTARYDELGRESVAAVREVRASVERMAADVARVSASADGVLAQGSTEIALTAQELRTAAESLSAAAKRYRDPRSILFGPAAGELGPGERR